MTDRSPTSTGLSIYVNGGLHKVLTLPATVLLAKTNYVMFLKTSMSRHRQSHTKETSMFPDFAQVGAPCDFNILW